MKSGKPVSYRHYDPSHRVHEDVDTRPAFVQLQSHYPWYKDLFFFCQWGYMISILLIPFMQRILVKEGDWSIFIVLHTTCFMYLVLVQVMNKTERNILNSLHQEVIQGNHVAILVLVDYYEQSKNHELVTELRRTHLYREAKSLVPWDLASRFLLTPIRVRITHIWALLFLVLLADALGFLLVLVVDAIGVLFASVYKSLFS